MKKFAAILLISVFTFSQYARHLDYLECKILNTFRTATMKCDCEKLAGFEKTGEDLPSAPKAHLHIHLDEFFAKPAGVLLSSFYSSSIDPPLLYLCNEPDGIYPEPWQPPNS